MLRVEDVDVEDRTYAVTPGWFALEKLRESIQTVGLLIPLRLETDAVRKLRLISGFRRLKAAQGLDIKEIPCIISSPKPPREVFMEALWENLACRSFTEVEKGVALNKLRNQFGSEESELIKEFLPLLELRPDRFHLERYLSIGELPEIIQKAMILEGLSTDIALGISRWRKQEQVLFIELVARYQLGRNRQKGFFEMLRDLRKTLRTTASTVWKQVGAEEIDKDSELSPQDRLAGIHRLLRAQRYPNLTQHEEKYRKLRNSLSLPSGTKLDVPPYFEGSRVSFTIDASSAGELRNLVRKSKDLLDRQELDEIFALL